MVGKLNKILCHICKRAHTHHAFLCLCPFFHLFIRSIVHCLVRLFSFFFFTVNAISFRRSIGIFAQHRMQDREIDDSAATAAAAVHSVMM